MTKNASLLTSQCVVQICLFLFAAIGIFGGTLQLYLGQPDTTPRLDNIHRFMAGIYLGTAVICLWAGITVRQQGTLVYLVALGVLLAGIGRLISMSQVGLPEPAAQRPQSFAEGPVPTSVGGRLGHAVQAHEAELPQRR